MGESGGGFGAQRRGSGFERQNGRGRGSRLRKRSLGRGRRRIGPLGGNGSGRPERRPFGSGISDGGRGGQHGGGDGDGSRDGRAFGRRMGGDGEEGGEGGSFVSAADRKRLEREQEDRHAAWFGFERYLGVEKRLGYLVNAMPTEVTRRQDSEPIDALQAHSGSATGATGAAGGAVGGATGGADAVATGGEVSTFSAVDLYFTDDACRNFRATCEYMPYFFVKLIAEDAFYVLQRRISTQFPDKVAQFERCKRLDLDAVC